jgi:superfamily II DNA or RNA helicase
MKLNFKQIHENKTKEQRVAYKSWLNSNCWGFLTAVTGFGKTRLGVIAACHHLRENPEETALIVVPSEILRDVDWPAEIRRWGYEAELESGRLTIECLQTSYKRKDWYFDTLVVDEVDMIVTPKYLGILRFNNFKRFLGLTADMSREKEATLNHLGISKFYHCGYKKALDLGLISDFVVYNLALELPDQDRKEYDIIENAYKSAATSLGGSAVAWRVANRSRRSPISQLYFDIVAQRTDFLYNHPLKIEAVSELLKNRFKNTKSIVFSKRVDFAESLQEALTEEGRFKQRCYIYHSKLKGAEKSKMMQLFRDSSTGILSCVESIDRGVNVPDCGLAVVAAGDSAVIKTIQRLGRTVRLSENKNSATFIQLYFKNTQEEKWIKRRSKPIHDKMIWVNETSEIPT